MTVSASDRPSSRSRYAAGRQRSPGALVAAVALNGGVIALLLTLHANGIIIPGQPALVTREFRIEPVPPPVDELKQADPKPLQRAVERQAPDDKPFVHDSILPDAGTTLVDGKIDPGPVDLGGLGKITPPVEQPHEVVFVGATVDPRYADAFHPAYPAALQRAGLEGSVTVRVTIDERGRVVDVAMVKASNRAFFEETREQALAHWRFRPATRDGVAVRSEQVMTVHFQLNA